MPCPPTPADWRQPGSPYRPWAVDVTPAHPATPLRPASGIRDRPRHAPRGRPWPLYLEDRPKPPEKNHDEEDDLHQQDHRPAAFQPDGGLHQEKEHQSQTHREPPVTYPRRYPCAGRDADGILPPGAVSNCQTLFGSANPTSPTRRKNERNLLICRIPAPKGRHYRAVDEPAGGRALWVIFGGGCAGNGSPS